MDLTAVVLAEYYEMGTNQVLNYRQRNHLVNHTWLYIVKKLTKGQQRIFDISMYMRQKTGRKQIADGSVIRSARSAGTHMNKSDYFRDEVEEIIYIIKTSLGLQPSMSSQQMLRIQELIVSQKVSLTNICKAYDLPKNHVRNFVYGNQLRELPRDHRRVYVLIYSVHQTKGRFAMKNNDIAKAVGLTQKPIPGIIKDLIAKYFIRTVGKFSYEPLRFYLI